jgi:hypothetical protein
VMTPHGFGVYCRLLGSLPCGACGSAAEPHIRDLRACTFVIVCRRLGA